MGASRPCQQHANVCSAATEGVVFVVRRRTKIEAQRQWVTASNGKQKLDNYFNRQFTDHISTQNGVKDNNGEVPAGVANVPRKWMWTVPRLREESMGIIRMPLNDPMMMASHGPPLLCLGEMAEWSRIATMKHCGLIEWRLMGQSSLLAWHSAFHTDPRSHQSNSVTCTHQSNHHCAAVFCQERCAQSLALESLDCQSL